MANTKITAANIDSTSTGFTLADLTVDTTTLVVDATNNRVGIGTTSPVQTVDISGSAAGLNIQGGNNRIYFSNYRALEGSTTGSLLQVGEGYTDIALQGNVGIGLVSPAGKLHIEETNIGATPSAQGNLLVLEDTENGLSILTSSAGAGYINFGDSDDNDVGMILYDHSANAMKFTVNASERMRILSDGKTGIGETSPLRTLHVNSGTTNVVARLQSTDGIAAIEFKDSGGSAEVGCSGNDVVFFPAGIEKMRVDSSGNVGITYTASLRFNGTGDSSHAVGYDGGIDGSFIRGQNGVRVLTGTGSGTERVRFDTNGNIYAQSATQNRIVLGSTGGTGAVNNSTNWIRGNGGSLQFNAASTGYVWESGGTARLALSSTGVVTQTTAGTSDSYDMILRSTDSGDPGLSITRDNVVGFGIAVRGATDDYADFQVNNGGQPGYTETGKLRIYSSGTVSIPGTALWSTGVGNTFGTTGNHYMVRTSSSTGNETIIINNTQTGSVGVLQYRESGGVRGSYFIATSANGIYSTSSSDYRFKENVATITDDYLTKLTSLRPITYTHSANYDDDTSTTHTGFIAHEVEEIFPEFVEGEKDAVWTQEELDGRGDPDTTNETAGDPKYQTVAYERKEWNVYIVRALQQLKAENESLKARIEALEG